MNGADCLFVYYLYRNGYDEGQTEFRRAAAALTPLTEAQLTAAQLPRFAAPAENVNLVAFLLAALGHFVAHRRTEKGQLLLEETSGLPTPV